jgi:hypothetical protein
MIDVKRKRCLFKGCDIIPNFNYEGKKKGLYCSKHKLDGMIDIKHKKCLFKGCDIIPNFNYEGKKKGLYCSKHKLDDMNSLGYKRCLFKGCNTQPCFNYEGKKKGLYCSKHKLDGMVDIKNKKCLFKGCNTQPCFNYEGKKKGLYCSKHKLDGMVNVIDKRCLFKGCNTKPCFNYEGKKKRLYCSKHKLDGMIDVKSKRCLFKGCNSRPTFNIPGYSPIYCRKKKKKDMIYKPTRKCLKCKKIAIYGKGKAQHCEIHKSKDDTNYIERECIGCGFDFILNDDMKCYSCDPTIQNKVKLAKQTQVRCFFDQNNITYESYDRCLFSGICGLERPDFLFKGKWHYVILEVDENQHYGRAEKCECNRMINIARMLNKPTIFLRYNPDSFKVNGVKKDITFYKRMEYLSFVLKCVINLKIDELPGFCSMRQIYFNEWDERNVSYKILLSIEYWKYNVILKILGWNKLFLELDNHVITFEKKKFSKPSIHLKINWNAYVDIDKNERKELIYNNGVINKDEFYRIFIILWLVNKYKKTPVLKSFEKKLFFNKCSCYKQIKNKEDERIKNLLIKKEICFY